MRIAFVFHPLRGLTVIAVKQNPDAFNSAGDTVTTAVDLMGDDGDLDPAHAISVNSAIAIEKEIAAETMGTLFEATPNAFLPFLEPSTLALIECLKHYYEGIRKATVGSLMEFIRTFYELSESPLWEPGAQVVSGLVSLRPRSLTYRPFSPFLCTRRFGTS